jgi:predicted dehydrogenase
MRKIRFGITGSGYMGRTHAEAIVKLTSTAELVAVWGGTRAPGFAKRFGIDLESSAESLANRKDIDAIIVTTPHHCHIAESMFALEAGKHLLIEKPMCTTVEDCDKILAAAKRRNLTIAIGYTGRFRVNPPKAKELIDAGAIGKVQSIHFSFFEDLAPAGNFGETKLTWLSMPESIGFIVDGLPHGIDLIRWFTGAEFTTVAGFCRNYIPNRPLEDSDVGIMELSNGAICSVNTTCALAGPYPRERARLSIVGSEGSIDLDPIGELRLSNRKDGWKLISTQPELGFDDPERAFKEPRMLAYYAQMQSFIDGIHGKPMVAGNGKDGREAVAVCLAMLQSTKERRMIDLAPA